MCPLPVPQCPQCPPRVLVSSPFLACFFAFFSAPIGLGGGVRDNGFRHIEEGTLLGGSRRRQRHSWQRRSWQRRSRQRFVLAAPFPAAPFPAAPLPAAKMLTGMLASVEQLLAPLRRVPPTVLRRKPPGGRAPAAVAPTAAARSQLCIGAALCQCGRCRLLLTRCSTAKATPGPSQHADLPLEILRRFRRRRVCLSILLIHAP